MSIMSILIIVIGILGVLVILYTIFRDPLLAIKSFFRFLKSGSSNITVLFFPIWGLVWLIDRAFNLKIFIKDIEEASIPHKIKFTDYQKYIFVDIEDIKRVGAIIDKFRLDYDPKEWDYNISNTKIEIGAISKDVLIKFTDISFACFNVLINYIENSSPKYSVYHPKGILISNVDIKHSYFVFPSTAYMLKLIGKSYTNRKLYVEIDPAKDKEEVIYYNNNVEYLKNFKYNKFLIALNTVRFQNC